MRSHPYRRFKVLIRTSLPVRHLTVSAERAAMLEGFLYPNQAIHRAGQPLTTSQLARNTKDSVMPRITNHRQIHAAEAMP